MLTIFDTLNLLCNSILLLDLIKGRCAYNGGPECFNSAPLPHGFRAGKWVI